MKNNLLLAVIMFVTYIFCGHRSMSQTGVDTLNPYVELINLSNDIYSADHLSFNITYYYEELDSTGVKRDTLSGVYKIDHDNFYAILDSTEIIQNAFYNTTVYHENGMIVINKPVYLHKNLLQVDIMDSLFQRQYVDSIFLSDSGLYRKLTVLFKEYAPYNKYELVYDITGSEMSYIKYSIRKQLPVPGGNFLFLGILSPNEYINVRIEFSNLQTGTFSDNVFNTDNFFTIQNGKAVPTAAFGDYDIINRLN